MALPNFLIIGAPKAGTTSLWHYLRQHPQIFMSEVKEPNYFRAFRTPRAGVTTTLEDYEKLFNGSESYPAVGEASPNYLCDESSIPMIKETIPQAKFIAILRDPYGRAFSEFTFHRMRGKEPVDTFVDAIEADQGRPVETRFDYVGHSLYHRNLKRYLDTFPSDRIKVLFNDDLRQDSSAVLREIFTFLGVDPAVQVDSDAELTVSGVPKVKALHWLLGRHNLLKDTLGPLLPEWARDKARQLKNANLERQKMSPDQRKALQKYFADDVEQLETLLGHDLSSWRAT